MLSTRISGLDGCECARLEIRLISIRRKVGFVGDSIQMSYKPLCQINVHETKRKEKNLPLCFHE